MNEFDFLVIGSGPAGQRAAIQAAKMGKRVAIFDRKEMLGGVSVHQGTIPSKTLREAALYLTGRDQRGLYGHSYRLKENLCIDDLMQRLNITLQHETEVIYNQLMRNGISLVHGTAAFKDEHVLEVENEHGEKEEYYGEKILVGVGSRPHRPDNVPFNDKTILDSDGILCIDRLPASMTIVGAGVIGVEYASIFSTLDTRVTLIDGRDTILGFLDREIVDELCHYMRKNNITLRLNENVADIEEHDSGKITLHLQSGKRVTSDMVMYAAGRIGCTWALQLDNAGVSTNKRRLIEVNEHFQTNVPHIYAAGDVIGFPSLASTSMEQGRIVARHAFGEPVKSQPDLFPFGIYAVPEISMVGMTEQELMDKGIAYETGVAKLHETARGQIRGITEGILKMMFALDDQRLLGVHIIGEGATEMIHIGQAVLVLGGSLDYFLDNVFNYPTLAEAYKTAALDAWNRMQ
jgi:NAD(P) transhydrogenase